MSKGSRIASQKDIQAIREWLTRRLGELEGIDFEEHIRLPGVRSTMRVWIRGESLLAFAYVDGYCNLWFDADGPAAWAECEEELLAWAEECIRQGNREKVVHDTLDCACRSDQQQRIQVLQRHAFELQSIRTIRYSLLLGLPMGSHPLPPGFFIREVHEQDRLEDLVALHRAAFATDHMTVAERKAIMQSPLYDPALDLLVVAPHGQLAAFCLAGFAGKDRLTAFTDPIGTHPHFQRLGLARVLVSAALLRLKQRGAERVDFATSSGNIPMNSLARSLGFRQVSEKLWFSKSIQ
jgi:mycothiol synthase